MEEQIMIIGGALLAVSEALALIPKLKSNSVFQLVINGIKSVLSIFKKK